MLSEEVRQQTETPSITTRVISNNVEQAQRASSRDNTNMEKIYLPGTEGRLPQIIHALGIIVIPTLAVAVALLQWIFFGVKTWHAVLMLSMWFLTILGITAGFHRLLSHRAYQASPVVKILFTVLGCMAFQGQPIYWATNHRCHHRFSDLPGDPHSPHCDGDNRLSGWRGFWHAHSQWSFDHQLINSAYFCKDLLRDRWITWVNRHYLAWAFSGVGLTGLVGYLMERNVTGISMGVLWGSGVRLFFTYHATNCINSITHLYGYRSYNTREKSRNNLWLAVPTLGEGWHNNHHAHPYAAMFGHRWWELDIAGWIIRVLSALKLVSDVHYAKINVARTPGGAVSPQRAEQEK